MEEKELSNQQGDVLLVKVDRLPDGLKPAKRGERGYVLAEGETTGHAHVIDAPADDVDVFVDEKGELFVRAKKAVTIKHEEHKHQKIKRGVYKVGKVREIDPFSEEIRSVRD
jgi:hypothetical protein